MKELKTDELKKRNIKNINEKEVIREKFKKEEESNNQKSFSADFLGLGTGYKAEMIPTEEIETKAKFLNKEENHDDCKCKVGSTESAIKKATDTINDTKVNKNTETSEVKETNKTKSYREIIEENKHGKGQMFVKASDSKVKKSFGKDKSGSKPFKNR